MPSPLSLKTPVDSAILARAKGKGLVPVNTFDTMIQTDLRYAKSENVFQKVLYPPGFPALAAVDEHDGVSL